MALAPCRECGTDISDAAATCPRCGVPEPHRLSARAAATADVLRATPFAPVAPEAPGVAPDPALVQARALLATPSPAAVPSRQRSTPWMLLLAGLLALLAVSYFAWRTIGDPAVVGPTVEAPLPPPSPDAPPAPPPPPPPPAP